MKSGFDLSTYRFKHIRFKQGRNQQGGQGGPGPPKKFLAPLLGVAVYKYNFEFEFS